MSGAPPPGPTCQECGAQKTMGTEEITYSSTRKDSETKGRQGTADLDSLVGEHNQQDTQTRGKSTERRSERNFPICPTAGCPQRKEDKWDLKRWELQNDPNLKFTPETRAQAMQKIEEDERRYENEVAAFRSGDIRAKEGGTMKHGKIKHREQENQRHQSDRTRQNVESSRRGAKADSTNQSDNRSRSPGEQEASTEWGNTEETDAERWGHPRESDTDEQETTRATAQGSTDQNGKQPWGHSRDTDTADRIETTTTTTTETTTTRTTERSTASESTNDTQTSKEQFMNGRSHNPENSPYGQIGTRSADAEADGARATKHDAEEENESQSDGQPSRRRRK